MNIQAMIDALNRKGDQLTVRQRADMDAMDIKNEVNKKEARITGTEMIKGKQALEKLRAISTQGIMPWDNVNITKSGLL